jgi:hypothetical protein
MKRKKSTKQQSAYFELIQKFSPQFTGYCENNVVTIDINEKAYVYL